MINSVLVSGFSFCFWFMTLCYLQMLIDYCVQDRPSTKVHAAPGGGSSLGYLFGGGSGGGGSN